MLNKIDGHTSLVRGTAINAKQMALVAELIKWNNGEAKMNRKTLKSGHSILRGAKASPYFIAKNVACKVKGEHGMYNLAVLKLSAEAAKAPKPTPVATPVEAVATPPIGGGAKTKGKKSSTATAKKGTGVKKEASVPKKGATPNPGAPTSTGGKKKSKPSKTPTEMAETAAEVVATQIENSLADAATV